MSLVKVVSAELRESWHDFTQMGTGGVVLFCIVVIPAVLIIVSRWFWERRYILTHIWRIPWMVASRKTYWAISMNGKFIEIRVAKRRPRAINTEFEKETVVSVWNARYSVNSETGAITFRTHKVPRKIHLKNVIHTGGKVVKALDSTQFWRLTHQSIPAGECLKLTHTQALAVLGKKALDATQ